MIDKDGVAVGAWPGRALEGGAESVGDRVSQILRVPSEEQDAIVVGWDGEKTAE